MSEIIGTKLLYAFSVIVAAFWFYKIYCLYKKREKSFDNDYKEILDAEKYKVRGKFES